MKSFILFWVAVLALSVILIYLFCADIAKWIFISPFKKARQPQQEILSQ